MEGNEMRDKVEAEKKMARWDCKKDVIPFTAMAATECINVSINTLYKAAAVKGLNYFVFVTYSYALGTIVLLPLIFIFPRTGLPPFKPSIFYRIVLLSIIGFSAHMCMFKGMEYSSPTLASVVSNLSPPLTFVLAVVFRLETLDFRRSSTLAKTIGTVFSISGALIAILYKGPVILSSPISPPQLTFSVENLMRTSHTNWVIGGLLLVVYCMLDTCWYIFQTHLIKSYPAELIVTTIYTLCVSIMATVTCFIAGTDIIAWTLRTNMALVTIIFSGFFGPNLNATVYTWGLHKKGPVYVTIFRPFSIVIAAAMGVIFLGDALHIGSVIGATIVLLGFYAVIWGKAKEEMSKDCVPEDLDTSTDRNTPLLRS